MKSFQEFLEEGRKAKIKRLSKEIEKSVRGDMERQSEENPGKPVIANFGNHPPGSKESEAAIMAMMRMDKRGRKEMKKRLKKSNNSPETEP
jgi:hypothetical protein